MIAIGKQADAFAQNNGVYQHLNLIDQVRVKQRMNEGRAADNPDLAAGLLLELADFLDDVGLDQRRVIPIRFLQRCRNNVLGCVVILVSNPEFIVRHSGPESREDLIRDPAQQKGIGVVGLALCDLAHFLGLKRKLPRIGRFHNPIRRQEFGHNDLPHNVCSIWRRDKIQGH